MNGRSALALLVLVTGLLACRRSEPQQPRSFVVPDIGLQLPRLPGWQQDASVALDDAAKGGVAARLVREQAVAGSPRVEIILDPVPARPSALEEVLGRALRDMAEFERRGDIKIEQIDRRAIRVGPRRGFRVQHNYLMGRGEAQLAITQISAIFILDGRGVTVTAAGRTELVDPLAGELEQMLTGMSVDSAADARPAGAVDQLRRSTLVKPVDLQQVGDSAERSR